jgi:hypothetical protein
MSEFRSDQCRHWEIAQRDRIERRTTDTENDRDGLL